MAGEPRQASRKPDSPRSISGAERGEREIQMSYNQQNPVYGRIAGNLDFQIDESGYFYGDPEWNFTDISNAQQNKLYFLTKGQVKIQTAQEAYILTPGHFYLLCSDHQWQYSCSADFEKLYFHFRLELYHSLDLFKGLNALYSLPDAGGEIQELCRLYHSQDPADLLAIHARLEQIVLRFIDRTGDRPARYLRIGSAYEEILAYVESHLRLSLNAEEICRALSIPMNRIRLNFKTDMGVSLKRYIQQRLFDNISSKLLYTNQSIRDIAEQYAFSDAYYFSNWFKRLSGMSPHGYRRALQYHHG